MNMNNRVYINPNFNMQPKNHPTTVGNNMHVNPKFSQQALQNKTRIYVNPSFVHSNPSYQNNLNVRGVANNNLNLNTDCLRGFAEPINNKIEPTCSVTNRSICQATQSSTSTSRYSLVRHNTSHLIKTQEKVVPKTTVQINKYKSVALCNYKNSLDRTNILQGKINKPSCSSIKSQKPPPSIISIKKTSTLMQYSINVTKQSHIKSFKGNKSKFVYRKLSSDLSRPVLISRNVKMKQIKRNLKKNNIPCPLFKKYGKCLRSLHGKCEFLHDKKHVSICRKFLKGICLEKDCPLSHEITSNKMPTCYFYLKGMCTRDGCPYLHVKLSDKTKVCPDFLKGYCEYGDKCLNRHIVTQEIPKKDRINRRKICGLNITKTKSCYVRKRENVNICDSAKKKIEQKTNNDSETTSHTDNRYYREIMTTAENCNDTTEVIKPTRCKLGTLPSFIKL